MLVLCLALGWIGLFAGVAMAQPPGGGVDARRRTPVVEVFETARDGVVNIASTQVVQVRSPFGFDSLFDERFDLFFDRPQHRRHITRTSVGSGFVLHEAGYIVTNAHVVARTAERRAIFADGSEYEAQVVALDEPRDLAILRIDPQDTPLHPIPLGTSHDLMVGETVVAIGNPLGYQHTVTAGVVSALDRTLPIGRDAALEGLIQTDASINPGNSGGPLLNILGQLVGVNTAIRADAQGIGFAIPVDQLRELLPAMLDVERRRRVRLGIRVDPGSPATVTHVEDDSPATGVVRVGDVVRRVGRQPVRSGIDFYLALMDVEPGELTMELLAATDGDQAGQGREVSVPVVEVPRPDGAALLAARLGLEAQPMDAAAARRLGLTHVHGLIVTAVEPAGPAAQAGVQRGDVLIQLGRHQPSSLDQVGELLESVQPGDAVSVGVLRIQGRTLLRATTTLRAR